MWHGNGICLIFGPLGNDYLTICIQYSLHIVRYVLPKYSIVPCFLFIYFSEHIPTSLPIIVQNVLCVLFVFEAFPFIIKKLPKF